MAALPKRQQRTNGDEVDGAAPELRSELCVCVDHPAPALSVTRNDGGVVNHFLHNQAHALRRHCRCQNPPEVQRLRIGNASSALIVLST